MRIVDGRSGCRMFFRFCGFHCENESSSLAPRHKGVVCCIMKGIVWARREREINARTEEIRKYLRKILRAPGNTRAALMEEQKGVQKQKKIKKISQNAKKQNFSIFLILIYLRRLLRHRCIKYLYVCVDVCNPAPLAAAPPQLTVQRCDVIPGNHPGSSWQLSA